MADANLNIKVGAEVELEPGPRTCEWLVSLGWTPPEESEQGHVAPQVIALYEQWVKDGAPPLGVPLARWWDKKLVELHDAIRPSEDADVEEDYDPRPLELVVLEEFVPEARPLRTGRAMSGAEAMRHRAAALRRDLMNELSSPERVDEMLRCLDINVEALPSPECDC